jgi:hypothetical protein
MSRTARMNERASKHRDAADRATDGFVRTPDALAEDLAMHHRDLGHLSDGARVLEPSAGDGAMVAAILEHNRYVHVDAVEPNERRAAALDALAARYPGQVTVHRATFEDYAAAHPPTRFDAVIMNPPFGTSARAEVWMDHVRLAHGMLHTGGQVLSVVPGSYEHRSGKAAREFRAWAQEQGSRFELLPGGAFTASGTGVVTGVLTVNRPMPPHPDGTPSWIWRPTPGVPVASHNADTSALAAGRWPVQEYPDRWDGRRPRVIRYSGTCHGCGRPLWEHDDRADASVWEARRLDASEFGQAGPSVQLCLECCNDAPLYEAAIAAMAPYWTADANADPLTDPPGGPGPRVYPLDLAAGLWVTVQGVDRRGISRTLTGRVMADPVHEPERAEMGDDGRGPRVVLELRTATGFDYRLYARESDRVIVRDVAADVIPASKGDREDWTPPPAFAEVTAARTVELSGQRVAPPVAVELPEVAGDQLTLSFV